MAENDLVIEGGPVIPEGELAFAASRSGGPGGQNVNKVNSRVTISFDVANSPSLTDEQRQKILERLATRVTTAGVLQVSSQTYRTQAANRDAAVRRLADLLASALREQKPRKKTRVPRVAKAKRIEAKKQRGQVKALRGRPRGSE